MLAEKLFEIRSIGLVVLLKMTEMGGVHTKWAWLLKICTCFAHNHITETPFRKSWIRLCNKKALFMTLVDHVPRFEAHWSLFFTKINATDSLCLLVAQMPRHRDMVIFVLTTTTAMTTTMVIQMWQKYQNSRSKLMCKFIWKLDKYQPKGTKHMEGC